MKPIDTQYRLRALSRVAVCLMAIHGTSANASLPEVTATKPASMTIQVSAGEVNLPNGKSVSIRATELSVSPPEFRTLTAEKKGKPFQTPINKAPYFDSWEPWPAGTPRAPNLVSFSPATDDEGTLILGSLYRYWRPETLEVTGADGEKKTLGKDYVFNADWGQIANLNGGLGQPKQGTVKASIEIALPRLDLVQVNAQGEASLKKGKSAVVCPELPDPDAGCVALAGVYIAPWRASVNPNYDNEPEGVQGASEYAVTATEIYPIQEARTISGLNPGALKETLNKLEAGQNVKIAFMGDSVTLGAEAPRWFLENLAYTEKDKTYRGRFVYGLKQRYPGATITPIAAYEGGKTVEYGVEVYNANVASAKPDLVVIAFGLNDFDGPVNGAPRNSPSEFKAAIAKIASRAQEEGAEVLLVPPFPTNPWMLNGMYDRQPEYNQVLLDLANEKGFAYADVYNAFLELEKTGMPTYNTLHNWKNHPGDLGHKVYADTILALMGVQPARK